MGLFQEFYQTVSRIIKADYPEFLNKKSIGNEIPAFVYHNVDKKSFEEHLQHLKRNNYETLTTFDLENLLSSSTAYNDKKYVILTFDDGLENLYKVAYPLLRTYNFKAVAFIVPFWIGKKDMLSWEQIREMNDSEVVDFQSHSYCHGRIPVSSQVVDFFHPKYKYYRK